MRCFGIPCSGNSCRQETTIAGRSRASGTSHPRTPGSTRAVRNQGTWQGIYPHNGNIVVIIMTTRSAVGAVVLLILLALALVTVPAAGAGSLYLSGTPDLVATIEGANSFSPGSEATLVIHVRNTGVDTTKILQPGGGATGEPPSTARMVTLTLLPGDAPLRVITDPRMAGDIPSGEAVSVPFTVRLDRDAAGGMYQLRLRADYMVLASEALINPGSVTYLYETDTVLLDLPFRVRDEVILAVRDVHAPDLDAGGEGYVMVMLENTGSLEGTDTTALLFPSDESPVIPTGGQVFIGAFPPGAVETARFKVRVDEKAGRETYPVNVAMEYTDRAGAVQRTREVTIGVPVIGKTGIIVVGEPVWIYRGAREEIRVEYENTGPTTLHAAQARISAVDPFTAYDDIAFLGDISPGGRAVATFTIGVDKAAIEKEYGLDTEIRYRDSLDNRRISDPMKVSLYVRQRTGLQRILSDPVLVTVIIAGVIGAGYAAYHHRKKKPRDPAA